jgi:tRNA dimethylallyltransferase
MMRALEVVEATGHSILSYREAAKKPRDFSVTRIGLDLPREQLIRNINIRVDQMMEDGLLEEVRSLYPYRHLNALQTVGYAELFEYLEGKCSLPDAVERIRVNTRQYAKRQLTWFRKEPGMNWFSPLDQAEIIKSVDAAVKG